MKRLLTYLILIIVAAGCGMSQEEKQYKINELEREADKHFDNLDIKEYINVCEEILSLEPENKDEYYFDMGFIFVIVKKESVDNKKAIEYFSKAIKYNPENESAHFFRGESYRALGKLELAIADYTKSINLKPYIRGLNAYTARGACKEDLGDFEGAIEDYSHVIEFYGEDKFKAKFDLFLRANVYLKINDTINACNDLNIIADSTDAYIRDFNNMTDEQAGSFYPEADAYDLVKEYCKK